MGQRVQYVISILAFPPLPLTDHSICVFLESDVLSFNILGRPIIVLNSREACHDLLDKRGTNYNDRPRFVLFEVYASALMLTHLELRN